MDAEWTARDSTREAHIRAVARVIDAMHARHEANMSLGEMANIAYMSRYHFERTFRHVTGVRPRQYLRALRLRAALRLLLQTSASVTDVCFDVGYNSLGTFVRCFTDLLGLSPRRVRLLAKSQESAPRLPELEKPVEPAQNAILTGRIVAPEGFDGRAFIGLFTTPMPQGAPVACTIASGAGEFRISGIRDGNYHLFALGVPAAVTPRELFLCESALRAGGQRLEVERGAVTGDTELHLRAPSPLDPPVLVMMPALLAKLASRHVGQRSGNTAGETTRDVARLPDKAGRTVRASLACAPSSPRSVRVAAHDGTRARLGALNPQTRYRGA
jgi:AraC family transcriptional regulator